MTDYDKHKTSDMPVRIWSIFLVVIMLGSIFVVLPWANIVAGDDNDNGDGTGDGIDDAWEDSNGLDKTDPDDGGGVRQFVLIFMDDNDIPLPSGFDPNDYPFSGLNHVTDPDDDHLTNLEEYLLDGNDGLLGSGSCDPLTMLDEDGDSLADEWEVIYGLNPTYDSDAWYDLDRDGYRNLGEFVQNTDPTDASIVPDDSDEDDSDADGVCNFGEFKWGFRHTDSSSHPPYTIDWDEDGVPDTIDTDGDGLSDKLELFGTPDKGSYEDDASYTALVDMSPCDSDTDHDGFQVDDVNDDGDSGEDGQRAYAYTAGNDGMGMTGTVYGPKIWEDYDDDFFIEGFNDYIEYNLGSNPAVPNTWEAFNYGWNFFPDETNDGLHGLHRYVEGGGSSAGYDNTGQNAKSLIKWTGDPISGDSQSPYQTFDNDINRDNDVTTGSNGKEFSVPPSLAKDGWILASCNYDKDKTDAWGLHASYEVYYNIYDQTMRIYLFYFGDPNPHDSGILTVTCEKDNGEEEYPIFHGDQNALQFYLNEYATSLGFKTDHWYYAEFPVYYHDFLNPEDIYVRLELTVLDDVEGEGIYNGAVFGTAHGKMDTTTQEKGWVFGTKFAGEINHEGWNYGPSTSFTYSASTVHTHTTSNWWIDLTQEGKVKLTCQDYTIDSLSSGTATIYLKPRDYFALPSGSTYSTTYDNQLGIYRIDPLEYAPQDYEKASVLHAVNELDNINRQVDGHGSLYFPALPGGSLSTLHDKEEKFEVKRAGARMSINAAVETYTDHNTEFVKWRNDAITMDITDTDSDSCTILYNLYRNDIPNPRQHTINRYIDDIRFYFTAVTSFTYEQIKPYVDASRNKISATCTLYGSHVTTYFTGILPKSVTDGNNDVDAQSLILVCVLHSYEMLVDWIDVCKEQDLDIWYGLGEREDDEDVYIEWDLKRYTFTGDSPYSTTGRAPNDGTWGNDKDDGQKQVNYPFVKETDFMYADATTLELKVYDEDEWSNDDTLGEGLVGGPDNFAEESGSWIIYCRGEYSETYSKVQVSVEVYEKYFVGTDPDKMQVVNGISFTYDKVQQTIKPSKTAVYPCRLWNTYAYPQTVTVSGSEVSKNRASAMWNADLVGIDEEPKTVTLGANSVRTGISYRISGDFDPKISQINIEQDLPSSLYPGDIAVHKITVKKGTQEQHSFEVKTKVEGSYGVSLYCEDTEESVSIAPEDPAESAVATYPILVSNTGDVGAYVQLYWDHYDWDTYVWETIHVPNWAAQLHGDIYTDTEGRKYIFLDAGEQKTVYLEVTGATPDDYNDNNRIRICVHAEMFGWTVKEDGTLLLVNEKANRITTITSIARLSVRWNPEDIAETAIETIQIGGHILIEGGQQIIKRKLEPIDDNEDGTIDWYEDPATREVYHSHVTSSDRWRSDEPLEEWLIAYDEDGDGVTDYWYGETYLYRIIEEEVKGSGIYYLMFMPRPQNADPEPIVEGGKLLVEVIYNLYEDVTDGEYYDPVTGLLFVVGDHKVSVYEGTEPTDENKVGELSEDDEGVYSGTVILKNGKEIWIQVDLNEPSFRYRIPPTSPQYGVELWATNDVDLDSSNIEDKVHCLKIFNKGKGSNGIMADTSAAWIDFYDLFWVTTYDELRTYEVEYEDTIKFNLPEDVRKWYLSNKNIYIRLDQDIITHMYDSLPPYNPATDSAIIRFDGDVIFGNSIPDDPSPLTYGLDLFHITPIKYISSSDKIWDFQYFWPIAAISKGSITAAELDGHRTIHFTVEMSGARGTEEGYSVSNRALSTELTAWAFENEKALAIDTVTLRGGSEEGIDSFIESDDVESYKQTVIDYFDSWTGDTPDQDWNKYATTRGVTLTAPDTSSHAWPSQSIKETFTTSYTPPSVGPSVEDLPLTITPASVVEVDFEITALPSDWEAEILSPTTGRLEETTYISDSETLELILRVEAADDALPGDYSVKIAAKNPRGQLYDNEIEFIITIVSSETIDTTITHTDMMIPVAGDITVANGGNLVIDNCVLELSNPATTITIEVANSGMLLIKNSIIKPEDASCIYNFRVLEGGMLTIENSAIYDVNNGIQLLSTLPNSVVITNSVIQTSGGCALDIDAGTPVIFGNAIQIGESATGIAVDIASNAHPVVESNFITSSAATPISGSVGIYIPSNTGDIVVCGNHITRFGIAISLNRNIQYSEDLEETSGNFIHGNDIGIDIGTLSGDKAVDLVGNVISENAIGIQSILSPGLVLDIYGEYIANPIDFKLEGGLGNPVEVTCTNVVSDFTEPGTHQTNDIFNIDASQYYTIEAWYSMEVHVFDDSGDVQDATVSMTGNGYSTSDTTDAEGMVALLVKHYNDDVVQPQPAMYNTYTLEVDVVCGQGTFSYTESNICMITPQDREIYIDEYTAAP